MSMEDFGWSVFFSELGRLFDSCERQIGVASEAYSNYIIEKLEYGLRNVYLINERLAIACEPETELEPEEEEVFLRYREMTDELISCMLSLLCYWDTYLDDLGSMSVSFRYSAEVTHRPGRGRPVFSVEKDQIEYLHSLHFSWPEISNLLGISRMTLYRRRRDFGLLQTPNRVMSSDELTGIIQQLRHDNPYCGETMIMGHLRAMDVKVTRDNLRSIIRSIDPLNTALRWQHNSTSRRPYSVPGPNSLWHLDGHHKLVRWRFVTHCGIDGYSRLIMFMKCSTNNKASTVLHCFTEAVQRYGLPSRVRTDQGRENILVAQFMLENRGPGRGSIITGSSVHNQRIERIWRDMHRCVTQLYYRLFYFLEERGSLNPVNELHLFALHHVFLGRINKSLASFKDGWNMHSLRTERNHSPLQLFNAGVLRLQNSGYEAMDFFQRVDSGYGTDYDEPVVVDNDDEGLQVPETRIGISEIDYENLCTTIDLSREANDYGISFYLQTVEFLQNHCPSLT